jgi:hypothetical protein
MRLNEPMTTKDFHLSNHKSFVNHSRGTSAGNKEHVLNYS